MKSEPDAAPTRYPRHWPVVFLTAVAAAALRVPAVAVARSVAYAYEAIVAADVSGHPTPDLPPVPPILPLATRAGMARTEANR